MATTRYLAMKTETIKAHEAPKRKKSYPVSLKRSEGPLRVGECRDPNVRKPVSYVKICLISQSTIESRFYGLRENLKHLGIY